MPETHDQRKPIKIKITGQEIGSYLISSFANLVIEYLAQNGYVILTDEQSSPDVVIVLALHCDNLAYVQALINGLEFGGYAILYFPGFMSKEDKRLFDFSALPADHEARRFVRSFTLCTEPADLLPKIIDELNNTAELNENLEEWMIITSPPATRGASFF